MTSEIRRKHVRKRKKRVKNPKGLSMFLLAISLTALIAGIGLSLAGILQSNRNFTFFGICYIAGGLTVFGLRGAIKYFYDARKRKYMTHA